MRFNAVALGVLPLLLWAWAVWVLARWQGRRRSVFPPYRWAPAIAVVLVWFRVRNIPVEPFTALRV